MPSTHLYLLHALSPIHCGTGQSISGIDLPIAREKPTGIPLVPGSSFKGVLRAAPGGYDAHREAKDLHVAAFGPTTENAADYAGAVQFSDANLLLLPMRSVRGTFAWTVAPYMLRRLARDVAETGLGWDVPWSVGVEGTSCLVTGDRLVVEAGKRRRVVLDDFDFEPTPSAELTKLGRQLGEALFGAEAKDEIGFLVDRLCVVADDVMRVLVRVGMEVTARNRLDDDTKTVARGALWTEEALPVESVLAGVIVSTPVGRGDRKRYDDTKLLEHVRSLCTSAIQVGGKATVGRGVCRATVL